MNVTGSYTEDGLKIHAVRSTNIPGFISTAKYYTDLFPMSNKAELSTDFEKER